MLQATPSLPYTIQLVLARTAAAGESRPKEGCCNRRLAGLSGVGAKIYFLTQSPDNHGYLRSKQQPSADKSAEPPQVVRVPLDAKKSSSYDCSFLCHIVPDYRTFIDDYLKILDFIEWLKVAYPEKAKFLTKKS